MEQTVEFIEPNLIKQLMFDKATWNFQNMMQSDPTVKLEYNRMATIPERMWYIKKKIRTKTWVNQHTTSSTLITIPAGLDFIRNPTPHCLLPAVRREMISLFKSELSLKPDQRKMPFHDYRKDRGLYYIFGTDIRKGQRFIPYAEGIKLLSSTYKSLTLFIKGYARTLCKLLSIDQNFLDEQGSILFIKYEIRNGIWLHVDNLERTDGGPICTINIGPPDINIDFVPVMHSSSGESSLIPFRANMNEGDMLMMQGESRYEWAHGIPYGLNAEKYTIVFKFTRPPPNLTEIVSYNKLLGLNVIALKPTEAYQDALQNLVLPLLTKTYGEEKGTDIFRVFKNDTCKLSQLHKQLLVYHMNKTT
jgi:hypothetical protein